MSEILKSPLNPTGDSAPTSKRSARVDIADTVQWLERLTANADFKRFVAFMEEGVIQCGSQAQNIDLNDAPKRDAYAQRYFGMKSMLEWPTKQLASSKNALKSLDESSGV